MNIVSNPNSIVKLNRKKIAELLGLDSSYVTRLLNGERKGPRAKKHLENIQRLLKENKNAA